MPRQAAVRALSEEMGIYAEPREVEPILVTTTREMNGLVQDNQLVHAFAYRFTGDISGLDIQKEEVESLVYMSIPHFRFELGQADYAKKYSPRREYFLHSLGALETKIGLQKDYVSRVFCI